MRSGKLCLRRQWRAQSRISWAFFSPLKSHLLIISSCTRDPFTLASASNECMVQGFYRITGPRGTALHPCIRTVAPSCSKGCLPRSLLASSSRAPKNPCSEGNLSRAHYSPVRSPFWCVTSAPPGSMVGGSGPLRPDTRVKPREVVSRRGCP